MANRDEIEFTYTSIDRIFRLSLGELADFSGAKYDGDFSLTLEQAQRRKHDYIAEQIGIGPGRRLLDLGCGWGALLDFARARGAERRRRGALGGAGRSVPPPRPRRAPARRAQRRRASTFGRVRRGREPRRLGALLLARGLPRRAPGGRLPRASSRTPPSVLPVGGRFYLQTMVFGRNMIPIEEVSEHAPRDSDAFILFLLGCQFPGSWLPLGQRPARALRRSRTSAWSRAPAGASTTSRRSRSGTAGSARRACARSLLKLRLLPHWLRSPRSATPSPRASARTRSASSASCSTISGWSSRGPRERPMGSSSLGDT